MTSHDVRDVLNLPADHATGPRPSKKAKPSGPSRPNLKGLAREVQNLGGDNPIAIVPEVHVFKKRRLASRKPAAKWQLTAFKNSGRGDNGALVLKHWKRVTEDSLGAGGAGEGTVAATGNDGAQEGDGQAPEQNGDNSEGVLVKKEEIEDSAFAKFNVQVDIPQYSDDQYSANLQNADWSKEETDYLLETCREYDLRWTLIWDRYHFEPGAATGGGEGNNTAMIPTPKKRTLEDLKARYYEVAHKMMAAQKPAQYMTRPEFELYEIMQKFNPVQEAARKQFAASTMARSKDEAREEESLLLEVKRILARTERFNEERRELYQRLDFPSSENDIGAFKTSAGLANLLQTLMNVDKSKKRKSIMGGPAGSDGVSPGGPGVPGSAISETGPHRRDSIAASASGHRDSIGTPATPAEASSSAVAGNKKKGAQQPERRKLSEHEMKVYGVSQHDRLSSGPTFRYEKVHKLYSHKSGQQQTRIQNVLAELDIPSRLAMPTQAVVEEFERLWGSVNTLVDMRKVSDKLDSEIKLEEVKRAERAKAAGLKGAGAAEKAAGNATTAKASEGAPAPSDAEKAKAGDATETAASGEKDDAATTNGANADTAPAAEDGDKKGTRPGSSSAHKRSASVLSTTSDKSAKRLKK